MMIAMTLVGMVKMTFDKVIDVIAVRDGGMAAIGSMNMVLGMPRTGVPASATHWIRGVYLKGMLFYRPRSRWMMQVPIVQIVHVIAMLDGGMAAIGSVYMGMMIMFFRHYLAPRIDDPQVGFQPTLVHLSNPSRGFYRSIASLVDQPKYRWRNE